MITYAQIEKTIAALPGVTIGVHWGNRTYLVGERGFAWQRPFSKADLKRFGDETPPQGEIFAVRVESLDAKDALLAMAPPGFFTIPHFNGYPAVLIELRRARAADVRAAIAEAYRIMAAMKPAAPRKKRRVTRSRSPRRGSAG